MMLMTVIINNYDNDNSDDLVILINARKDELMFPHNFESVSWSSCMDGGEAVEREGWRGGELDTKK